MHELVADCVSQMEGRSDGQSQLTEEMAVDMN